jgi:hypothetical protein
VERLRLKKISAFNNCKKQSEQPPTNCIRSQQQGLARTAHMFVHSTTEIVPQLKEVEGNRRNNHEYTDSPEEIRALDEDSNRNNPQESQLASKPMAYEAFNNKSYRNNL